MRLEIISLVLDGMPWITHHLPVFNRLGFDWRWTIAHGVAAPIRDTGWIKSQDPRLSGDGTTEYLAQIAKQHPRVRVLEKTLWPGKTAMCNACLEGTESPSILLEVDADEIWTSDQIEIMMRVFEGNPSVGVMQFWCRYFFGPNIIAGPRDGNSYGCQQTEWTRAWRRHSIDQRFITHEPPVLSNIQGRMMSREETRGYGLEFDHFAYATRAQLEYKERVYGYPGAVAGWDRLQANAVWPTKLKPFLPWVGETSTADLLIR